MAIFDEGSPPALAYRLAWEDLHQRYPNIPEDEVRADLVVAIADLYAARQSDPEVLARYAVTKALTLRWQLE